MAKIEIIRYGTPSLQGRSEPVSEITDEIRQLIGEMAEVMYASKGIGLAAPQVGRSIRLFIVDSEQVTGSRRNLMVFINPEILDESIEDGPYDEGCLSLPDIEGEVFRPLRIRVRALDEDGQAFEMDADDLLARAILHENDHLDGVLFIDRMAKDKRALLAGQLSAMRRETQAALAGAK